VACTVPECLTAAGYKIAFFLMTNGKPGPLEDFMIGFLLKAWAHAAQSM
jgi:hypothetical protein